MPKGQFIVMKTGAHPMKVKLKLFFQWGICFGVPYTVPDKGNRPVAYAGKNTLAKPSRKSTRPRKNPSSQRRKSSHPSRDRGTRNSMPAHLQKKDKTGKGERR